ncbi:MAG TPA: NUDIX hydrolase [Terriglobia bacterium]|nr:NUDIX hydrolase [Terriglobia bacterium]
MKREFPDRPVVGVGGVVIRDGTVLLIRRGSEPLKGEWSLPGGMLELGEHLEAAVRRELLEETGLEVEPVAVVEVFDRIIHDRGRVRYHYVIVDYLCTLKGGTLRASSDVTDARWVRRDDLRQFHLTEKATSVIEQSFALAARRHEE